VVLFVGKDQVFERRRIRCATMLTTGAGAIREPGAKLKTGRVEGAEAFDETLWPPLGEKC